MKEVVMQTKRRMKLSSRHQAFNRQTRVIQPGVHASNTQYSDYIHPYLCMPEKPDGTRYEYGEVQAMEMHEFYDRILDYKVYMEICDLLRYDPGYLYVFSHVKDKRYIPIGCVLTDVQCRHIKTWYLTRTPKTQSAVNEARKYVIAEAT